MNPADRPAAGSGGPKVRPELRLVLAVSLDGRLAPPSGGAAKLGGPGDRRVLEEALAWADACLIGAETLRRHGSTCLIHQPDLLERRHSDGRSAQPIAIAVSRSGNLPASLSFFRQPIERWLLLDAATESAQFPRANAPPGFSRRIPWIDWPGALERLSGHGVSHLAVLGGAALAGGLIAAGLLDELQLTLCPSLLGGGCCWLPTATELPELTPVGWHLVEHRPLGGDELLLRYCRGSVRGLDSAPAAARTVAPAPAAAHP